ncbi:MAG: triose-phosphate isomerase [Deltaproteobacteria bacterium]|nr:MAG: triose-phosphate isomerase [Deltaproteobacteria bacterium]
MRRPIIAGNWKMHKTARETAEFAEAFIPRIADVRDVEVVIAPPYTSIATLAEKARGTNLRVGAQNMHQEDQGAFTGEISAPMLKELGVEYVIIGHSERRAYYGETDEGVNLKVKKALASGLTPIMCVGETLEEREKDATADVVRLQVEEGLKGVVPGDGEKLVIAYEPVWAIGTGKTATPDQAQEVHSLIRKILGKLFGEETAKKVRILYGGSVKPENIASLMAQEDIDGALVGGASLKVDSFEKIVKYYEP